MFERENLKILTKSTCKALKFSKKLIEVKKINLAKSFGKSFKLKFRI